MIQVKVKELNPLRVKVDSLNRVIIRVKEVQPIIINAFEYPAEIDLLTQRVIATEELASEAITLAQEIEENKVDKVEGKGLSANDYSDADKNRLANTSGSNTGDQDLSGKVDKVAGKWLSENNFTSTLKTAYDNVVNLFSTKQDKLTPLATEEAATFTLSLTHLDKVIPCNSAVDMVVNIPTNADVAFEIGTTLIIKQRGVGVITATALSGVTLLGDPKTQGQYKMIALYKEAINTWTAIGGTA